MSDNFVGWLSAKLDMLCNISGRYPLNLDSKTIYVKKLYSYQDSKHLERLIDDYAANGKLPTANEIIHDLIVLENKNKPAISFDRQLSSPIANPEQVILAYLACKNFMPSIPRQMAGKCVDDACQQLFGEPVTDEVLRDKFPPETIKEYLLNLH